MERNALTAGLVKRAQQRRCSSFWARENGPDALEAILAPWPVECLANWARNVNAPITEKELDCLRSCVNRGQRFGRETWTRRTMGQLQLEHTIRREGQPKKENPNAYKSKD